MTATLNGSPAIGEFDGIDLDMLIRQGFRPVPVTRVESLTPEVLGIELTPAEATAGLAPGSHIEVAVPLPGGPVIRHYSLVAGPAETLRIGVLREDRGRGGSAWLHEHLASCTSLLIRGPRDTFGYRGIGPVFFVAGGIGITPLTAMIAAAASAGDDWHLLYIGRRQESMAFADALVDEYGTDHVTVHITESAGRPDAVSAVREWAGGRAADTTVYVCGPVPLMRSLETGLAEEPAITVISENFDDAAEAGPSSRAQSGRQSAVGSCSAAGGGGDDAFVVELGDGSEVEVPAGCSIIDALGQAGVRTLSSCQKGTCGTCETVILEGEADHRDSVLSAEEHAAQETMMICVSRACGGRIALDL